MNIKVNKTGSQFALLNDFFVHKRKLSTSYPQCQGYKYAILPTL